MVKNKVSGKKKPKIKELDQIGNVSNFTELPSKRSSSSYSSSSPVAPSAPDSLREYSYDRDEACSVTLTNFGDKKDDENRLNGSVYCSKSCDKRPGFLVCEFPALEAEPVALDKVSDPCNGRVVQNIVEQKSDAKKLRVTGSNGVCITPGNAVWAKTACHVWWPAEIISKGPVSPHSRIQQDKEHVLVKFYGKRNSAWVNAARDLSTLEDSFEERSCNPMENLQDALKQAIVQRKEHIKSCRQLPESPDSFTQSHQQDRKSGKRFSSISSKTGSNLVKQGKPKIQNGARFPLKSGEGARRLKIMRHLGLTAPLGSPF